MQFPTTSMLLLATSLLPLLTAAKIQCVDSSGKNTACKCSCPTAFTLTPAKGGRTFVCEGQMQRHPTYGPVGCAVQQTDGFSCGKTDQCDADPDVSNHNLGMKRSYPISFAASPPTDD
ncbi:MAG: hypothetical protein M1819_007013 [Sarea resinae]|nr:MAG: hypothetical protein M1819_007013 [Sarea resinae]